MPSVDIVALHESSAAALGMTLDTLDVANRVDVERAPGFRWRILSMEGGAVRLRHGVTIETTRLASARPSDIVIVLGLGAAEPDALAARLEGDDVRHVARWVARAETSGSIVAASCTAVFVLGAAGILRGRRCTTTWWLAPMLAQRFAGSKVETDAMVIEDRRVWTAGAAFAQADLMIALIASTASPAAANEVGRRLLVGVRGSQAPFIRPSQLAALHADVAAFEGHVVANLEASVSVDRIATAIGIGRRTLARRIKGTTGLSPHRFLQKIRLDQAIRIIGTTDRTLLQVAQAVGLSDAAVLHRLVVRHTGHAPGFFRRALPSAGSGATEKRTVVRNA